jgi:N-acetylmuramoyl-L-alanine amidase
MRVIKFAATVCIALSLMSTAAVAEKCDEDKQIRVLALNIYHEARGEPEEGMRMVGEVTINRVALDSYPDNLCDVVYQKNQFSWTSKKTSYPKEKDSWHLALQIAEDILEEDRVYYEHMSTHFLNTSRVKNMPSWARKFKKVDTIGNHTFYRMM